MPNQSSNEEKKLSTSARNQRFRIIKYLQENPGGENTLGLVKELDVLRPGARICELRQQGYNIITHKDVVETSKGIHKNARYVLLPGAKNV